jgi:ketosteroid isomerase-like protein
MAEESTTPDLVELTGRALEAGDRLDFDAMLSFWGPDPIWDMSPIGLGVYEGAAAIRGFFEDWIGTYEDWKTDPVEILDLGGGVVFVLLLQDARLVGSRRHVRLRYASVVVWENGMVLRTTNYSDIDEALAAAERLAEERG